MKTLIIALVLMLATLPASAQTPRLPEANRAVNRGALLQALNRGPVFISQGQEYQLLPEVRAVRILGKETARQTLDRLRVSDSAFLERKSDYALFRYASTGSGGARIERTGNRTLYPVALNPRTGEFALIPGTIIVQPKRMGDAQTLAAAYGLELYRAFAHLNMVFYRVKENQDPIAAAASLATDARVLSAEPETIENLRTPM